MVSMAVTFQLKPGFYDAYKKAHDELWPELVEAFRENGVNMVPITYPGVKEGEERLRLNVTRGHSKEDMDRALELLDTYGHAFFVLGEDTELEPMQED